MTWNPFKKEEAEVPNPEATNDPTNEKTPAEIIAESVAASLKPVVEKLDSFSQRLDAIDAATKKPEPKVENTELVSVHDDEDRAFAQRIGPVMLRQLETEARIARSEIKAEYVEQGYGEAWAAFEKEIDATLSGSPLLGPDGKVCRGNPEYIRNVVDMVFGRAAKKAGIKFGGRERGFFLENTAGGPETTNDAVQDGLTADQRRVFARMGITAADGKKTMAKLKFIN